MSNLAAVLKDVMKTNGWNQTEMAARIGVTQAQVHNYLAGQSDMSRAVEKALETLYQRKQTDIQTEIFETIDYTQFMGNTPTEAEEAREELKGKISEILSLEHTRPLSSTLKWEDGSSKTSRILFAQTEFLTMKLVYGHIDKPLSWLLSTVPKLFDLHVIGDSTMTEENAKETAVKAVLARLTAIKKSL